MSDLLSAKTDRVLRAFGAGHDETLAAMAAHAEDIGYPIVGPDVGQLLSVVTRLARVERAFEFGSGFGYSAYWIARALPDRGRIVLTEVDETHLERAQKWFDEAGLTHRAAFAGGDAHETFERVETSFDLIVLDHYNRDYTRALELVKEQLAPGGVIVADNVLTGKSVHLEDIVTHVDGEAVATNENTAGTIAFLETLTSDSRFETTLLPIGDGVSMSISVE